MGDTDYVMEVLRISLIIIGATILVGIYLFDPNSKFRKILKYNKINFKYRINTLFKSTDYQDQYVNKSLNDDAEILQQIAKMQGVVANPYGNRELEININSELTLVSDAMTSEVNTVDISISDEPIVAAGEELVTVFYIKVHSQTEFNGIHINQAVTDSGFTLTNNKMFELKVAGQNTDKRALCTLANAFEPGTFPEDMTSFSTTALVVFMCLPGPVNAMDAIEQTISICKKLAHDLDAELCDETHSVLTNQTISHIKEKVKNYYFHLKISHTHKS